MTTLTEEQIQEDARIAEQVRQKEEAAARGKTAATAWAKENAAALEAIATEAKILEEIRLKDEAAASGIKKAKLAVTVATLSQLVY